MRMAAADCRAWESTCGGGNGSAIDTVSTRVGSRGVTALVFCQAPALVCPVELVGLASSVDGGVGGGVETAGNFETVSRLALFGGGSGTGLYGEACGGSAHAAIPSVAGPWTGRRAGCPASRRHTGDGHGPLFHVGASIVFAVTAHAPVPGSGPTRRGCMCGAACPLEFPKDSLPMSEKITHEPVAILLLAGKTTLGLRAQNTRRESGGERRGVRLIRCGELEETGEVRGDGVQRRDVSETQLPERGLDHGESCCLGGFGGGSRVDGFDDLVDVGGNQ